MDKETAKIKFQNEEIQICFDVISEKNLEFLRFITQKPLFEGTRKYYKKVYNICQVEFSNEPYDLPIIKISEIAEIDDEVVWLSDDMEFFDEDLNKWVSMPKGFKYRLKPKPDYSAEIEALQQKAKENGMKCIISFEKL